MDTVLLRFPLKLLSASEWGLTVIFRSWYTVTIFSFLETNSFWDQSKQQTVSANLPLLLMEREEAKGRVLFLKSLVIGKHQTWLKIEAWLESSVIYKLTVLASSKWPGSGEGCTGVWQRCRQRLCLLGLPCLCMVLLESSRRACKALHNSVMSCYTWNWSFVNIFVHWAVKSKYWWM